MCPIGFLMLGSTLQDLPSDSPTACRSACRGRRASPRTGSHQRTILACTRPVLVGHAVELATGQPPPTTTARSTPTLGWPSSACASFERQAPTQADDEPGMDAAGDHADPDHPSRTAACPRPRSRTSLRPDTADAATHRHRTPDSGRRTADTWTLRRPHRTLDIGPVDRQAWMSLAPDTGHRTLDAGRRTPNAGRGRGQADDGAAGIRTSWATTPSDRALGRPTVFLWTAPAALGSPCRLGGEAAFQREIASRRQLLGRSAGVERRLGALLSSENGFGVRVERDGGSHPL
jgi:hypothetical protein